MATNAGVRLDWAALSERADGLRDLSTKGVERVRARSLATLKRRIKPEAARLLSRDVIALGARTISPYLSVAVQGDAVVLSGSRSRLPLSAFSPRQGSRGIIATLWRDAGPREFAHTFFRKDAKSGKKDVWQRVPYSGQKGQTRAPSGLVQRLPIALRKGQTFARAVIGKKHGDIYPGLIAFGRGVLADEVARLAAVELKK